jgi:hypothetical protein
MPTALCCLMCTGSCSRIWGDGPDAVRTPKGASPMEDRTPCNCKHCQVHARNQSRRHIARRNFVIAIFKHICHTATC